MRSDFIIWYSENSEAKTNYGESLGRGITVETGRNFGGKLGEPA